MLIAGQRVCTDFRAVYVGKLTERQDRSVKSALMECAKQTPGFLGKAGLD